MKRLPGWVGRDLRPTDFERNTALQPIDPSILAHSIRFTEPDSLWVRSTTRLLQELPEAKPWAARPHDALHGGIAQVFPNAPVGDEDSNQEPTDDPDNETDNPSTTNLETDTGSETTASTSATVNEPTLTEALPDLDNAGEPGADPILQLSAADVPIADIAPGLDIGDQVELSPEAQAILDAEESDFEAAIEGLEETVSTTDEFDENEALARLPPDPLGGLQVSGRKWGRRPLSAYDEPVPTPRWLLLLLLLFLGLAGGKTKQGEHFLDQLTREERAWSLNGQIGRGENLLMGPGIIVSGPAQVSRVSIGTDDTTIQLSEGQLNAQVASDPGRMLVVQAGPAVISTSNGTVDVIRDGETIHIWAENGKLWVRTKSETYEMNAGEHLLVEGGDSYGTSRTSTPETTNTSKASVQNRPTTGSSSMNSGQKAESKTNPSSNGSGPGNGATNNKASTGNTATTRNEAANSPTNATSSPTSSSKSKPNPSPFAPSTNAPVFSEPAGKPFDDVLEALDAVEGMTCDDDVPNQIDKESLP